MLLPKIRSIVPYFRLGQCQLNAQWIWLRWLDMMVLQPVAMTKSSALVAMHCLLFFISISLDRKHNLHFPAILPFGKFSILYIDKKKLIINPKDDDAQEGQ